ncbi:MAG TPA: MarR family winged helix-turn-helix transcriptional regulator [Gaiellaceae bacterium]|jgi:DNA-binding MarR family transcriptional regulator
MSAQISEPRQPAALPEELRACTVFLLGRVGWAMKTAAIEEFERSGFSPYQYSVLAVLSEGEKETQATIADTLRLDRGQLVGILDELEEAGMIARRRDEHDRRRHVVSLTPTGKKRLVKMRALVAQIEDSFLGALDRDERAALHDVLLRVAAANDCRFQRVDP